MKPAEQKVITEAIRWWKIHRPASFTEKEHLENPTINCYGLSKRLAEAVARFLKNNIK